MNCVLCRVGKRRLTGDRKGAWSLSVTKNWRLTFMIDQTEIEIFYLDYEDYH